MKIFQLFLLQTLIKKNNFLINSILLSPVKICFWHVLGRCGAFLSKTAQSSKEIVVVCLYRGQNNVAIVRFEHTIIAANDKENESKRR